MISPIEAFKAFEQQNILVIGDVMIDRYLRGAVERISPEAPVPVVRLLSRDNRLGGAANVALNLKALGAKPYLCSVIGQDRDGELLRELLPQHQLSAKGIITAEQRVTTVKSRVLAGNQQLLRVDEEDTHPISETSAKALFKSITELLDTKNIHAILLQDYNKGVLSAQLIKAVLLEAIKRDIPTAVDPKSDNFWVYKHVTLFKPNLKEIQAQMPFAVTPDLEALDRASEQVHRKLGNPYTLITLSEKGVYLNDNGRGQLIPTQARAITDVCGAGDTVFAVAGLGLSLQMGLADIAQLANLAGGQVCEKVGVVPVDREQLEAEYTVLAASNELS